jgi:hypothetical protein
MEAATMRIASVVIALALVSGITSASAQQARTPASKPQVIIRDQDIFRAPPRSPASRPDRLPPPEIGTPRQQLPPLPEMKPRVGDH